MLREREPDSSLSIASGQYGKERDYWLEKLSGELIKSHFPYDFRDKKDTGAPVPDTVEFTLPPPLAARLTNMCKGSDYTLAVVLTAGVIALLSRYSGNKDIVAGMPIYRQDSSDDFINTVLVLRNTVDHDMTFKELLLQVRQTVMDAEEHQNYAVETLLYQLNIPVSDSGFPLFDTAVLLENIQQKSYIGHIPLNTLFSFRRTGDTITGLMEYNPSLYRKETAQRVVRHYTRLLEILAEDVNAAPARADFLSKEEKEQLLFDFNDTAVEYPREKTIVQLFEEQVEKKPDAVAVSASSFVSYRCLNRRAARFARLSMEKGVKPGAVVALMMERTVDKIVGIMGVLKAGGAYLPIEPDCPAGRVRYMLADSNAQLLVKSDDRMDIGVVSNADIRIPDLNPSSVAYVIYTSGSTGKPRGVLIRHRNLHYLVTGLKERIYKRYTVPLNVALVSPYSFDASVKQVFGAILSGHTLDIVPGDTRIDGYRLLEYFKRRAIDVTDGTPTHIQMLLETGMGGGGHLCLKHLLIGGEALHKATAAEFLNCFPGTPPVIANVYGPTECSVDTTVHEVNRENIGLFETVPIGKPMPNAAVYILGPRDRPQPIGVGGELCIGGDGVSPGYLNNPELTAERFYRSNRSYKSYRTYIFYKTGDLARWLPDGSIEFLGRNDTQVKIRGYRIELEEIVHCLLTYPPVGDAVVLARDDNAGDKYLCAYFTSAAPADTVQMKEYLSRELPDYMVPSRFVQLEKIPLTPNGKIDRGSLPEPGIGDTAGVYIAPRDSAEEELVGIWSRVLKIDAGEIGIDTDFFDIGGHSLRATVMVAAVHKAFDTRVPLQEIFKTPTVRGISTYIENHREDTFTAIEAVEEREYYFLSAAQKRLYVSQHMDVNSTGYTMVGPVLLEGWPDPDKMETAFRMLTRRHESLRTSFVEIEGEPRQRIHKRIPFNLETYRMQEAGAMDFIREQFIRPFDLGSPPLFRIGNITINETRHILVFHMHHIIADGTSLGILLKEFMQLYEGETLAPLPLRYVDYCRWQEGPGQKQKTKKQEQYWLKQLEGDIPGLDLPLDFPRPAVRSFEGGGSRFRIDAETTRKIKESASREDVTLHMFLSAVFNLFLFKITGREDILVGSPIANRLHTDLQPLVGTFPNILAIRNHPRKDQTFASFLKETRKQALDAYANQEYQLEALMDRVIKEKDPGRNSLFDVFFHLHNVETPVMETENFRLTPIDIPLRASRYDLAFSAFEQGGHIQVQVEYSTRLFKEETIALFIRNFQEVIAAVLENRDIPAGEINIHDDGVKRLRGSGQAAVAKEETYAPPRDKIEKILVDIFSEVLSVPVSSVGIDTGFFRLGGHSLKATTAAALIYKKLEVKMPLAELFRLPTVRELAGYIRGAEKERSLFIAPVEKREYYPMSAAQRSMYIQYQKDKNNLGFNMSQAVRIKGRVNKERMETILLRLIRRHESFRTSFIVVEDEPVQRVCDSTTFSLDYYEVETRGVDVQGIVEDFTRPFDLTSPPLIRSGLIKEGQECFTWMLDMHHIIYDGTSVGIFIGEFTSMYQGEPESPPPRIQYKDFTCWQHSPEGREYLNKQEAFWLRELSGELPRLNLPVDFQRPPLQVFRGRSFKFLLNEEKTRLVTGLAAREKVTLFTVLFSLFAVLLSRLCGQEDIIVGAAAAARRHADVQGIFGMFVNSIALRSFPTEKKDFTSFLRETGQKALGAFENQEYPFEQLVRKLPVHRDVSRNPLFDALFVLQNTGAGTTEVRGLELEPVIPDNNSHFDLVLSAREERETILLELEYADSLFKPVTIETFAKYYIEILEQVTADPSIPLGAIRMTHGLVEAGADTSPGLTDEWEL